MTNVKNVKLLVQSLKACGLQKPPIKSIIDCISKTRTIKLPGLIDVHVHLREPGGCHKEDIVTGTSAALAGGFTMVCAMPNTNPAITNAESLKLAEDLYEKKGILCPWEKVKGARNNRTIHEFFPSIIHIPVNKS
jgi:carbamoyl-phosphate synthase/aspartate carbamoyltransferase/dihydroorotase